MEQISLNTTTTEAEAPILWSPDAKSFSIFGYKEYNQSDFGVGHLVMSMCRVFSCVLGRGCLL